MHEPTPRAAGSGDDPSRVTRVLVAPSAQADIEAIRYQSVRDPERRANVAVLAPAAFAAKRPKQRQAWRLFPRPHAVQAWRESPALALEFPLAVFAADPRLAPLGA
jgi:hypothetical protein